MIYSICSDRMAKDNGNDGDLRGLFSFAFNKLAGIRFYESNALRQRSQKRTQRSVIC